ncbi:MAG: molybdopterin-dependent oxidoreductase [Ignavibacteria bacterium]|nr:molybdopterin-dependent oxidoreductase [Ignavibacteria bacterium]MBT8383806.1 molybdopterin-dependent oxidoreductase [Ignavibacteria bacterium]MBT8391591.1 molybdopterin-dependent oxidoreductase [Ignavibacteria bacterium]NNJ53724.1 molybdopterin-dependent oxidoreductase [Ignavibacteriaceae bacterium]NNL21543.1 molybdopterin-dependent oxidoreductase [Ignavibacteriaceae bacterium]
MKNYDIERHVRGESQFVDDISYPKGLLYAAVCYSDQAHGEIINIDISDVEQVKGIKLILTAKDIPGENQIGGIVPDEELLAEYKVEFIGQPIAIVVADDQLTAKKAARKIKVDIKDLPIITDARKAYEAGKLIVPPRTFNLGNVDDCWKKCDYIIQGTVESGGQEHLYLETQGAFAYPVEGRGIKIISSTQAPTAVQRVTARILNLAMHKIEVDVPRIGGGFGGKEDQATAWAVICALAAYKTKYPVKLILSRQEDMRATGKRHPYTSDFKIGLNKKKKIIGYEVTFYQNAGAAADLSPAILERTLFHCTNSYYIPNVKATAYSCKTNLPPNTAFRGFGGPQGMFVIESAMYKAAEKMGIDTSEIQNANLIKENDEFPYGQKAENCNALITWKRAEAKYSIKKTKDDIKKFNDKNDMYKKGIAFIPICFGISFTNTSMNQASALVHVYTDGSVSVSTAAVEMGQGVNEKIRQIATETLSINIDRIKTETTNTTRIANTSPTAASSAADLNGKATEQACNNILERLKKSAAEILNLKAVKNIEIKNEIVYHNGKRTKLSWNELVKQTNLKRVNLSSHSFYATPNIYFDREKEKGNPFAYHVYGTAIIEVTVDCLRGIYKFDSVKVVHDFGKSFNPIIDRGQAEGAIVQGLGWMTIEEVMHDENARLLTDSLSTYKVPDMHFTPEIEIEFLKNVENPMGIFKSKAIGEPPFMYGIGGYFAIMNALKAFRPNADFKISSPITPEKVLLNLHSKIDEPVTA